MKRIYVKPQEKNNDESNWITMELNWLENLWDDVRRYGLNIAFHNIMIQLLFRKNKNFKIEILDK